MKQTDQKSQSLDAQSTEQQAAEKELTLEELASITGGFVLALLSAKAEDAAGNKAEAG